MPSKEQRNKKCAVDGLSDQLADVKIDHKNDMAMDDLVNKLASKWKPNKVHTLSPAKEKLDTKGSRREIR